MTTFTVPPLQADHRRDPATFIRMSSAGKCRRQIGYDVLGFPESDPTPVPGQNVMELGDAAEAILVRLLKNDGWEVDLTRWNGEEQLAVMLDDPPRVGHPDGRCRHPELTGGRWVLLECKGMNAFQFRKFLRDGFLKSHPAYVDQVAQYGVALHRKGLVVDPCAGVVAALDRDTGRWGFQRVRWQPQVYTERTEALARAWALISSGQLPERDYDGTSWHCSQKFCRWSTLCWVGSRPAQEATPPAEGTIDGVAVEESPALFEATQLWREGKDLESRGKSLQDEAKESFHAALERHGAKKLNLDGLSATLVTSTRRSWDDRALRKILTEAQIREVQKQTESTSLRIVDTGENDPFA
jgi:hypothetical protein